MTQKFDVDAKTNEQLSKENIALPKNILTIGRIKEDDNVNVYINQQTFHDLERMARSDTTREVGTVLLGNYTRQNDKIHVIITEFIEAKYTDPSTTTLTFTHETWDYINQQHAMMYDGLRMVGWQHTHPNYGIYLSNYGIFLQENFFNMPFQVAYVIDPVQNKRGFFRWKDDEIESLSGFYVFDEPGREIKIDKVIKRKAISTRKPGAAPYTRVLFAVLVALVVACAALLGYALLLTNKSNIEQDKLIKEKQSLQSTIDSKQKEIDQKTKELEDQKELLKEVQETLINSIVSANDLDEIEYLIDKIQSGELSIEEKEKTLEKLEEYKENYSDPLEGLMVFKPYIVQRDENLTEICKKHNLNYKEYANIILSVNGIKNQNKIYTGQKILLPMPAINQNNGSD